MLCLFGSAIVSWMLKKQRTIALSNTKIEYRVATQATCEALWLKICTNLLDLLYEGKFKYFMIT